jgi:uncharacterized RDD family membrane protein YckC
MTQPASAQIAPVSRRAIGFLIDAFIAAALAIVLFGGLVVAATLAGPEGMLTTLLIGAPIVSLLLLGWFVVYTLMQAGKGSIGMRAQGLRLASAADQTPLRFGRALLRNIIFGLACSIVVGYFTPLFDGSGRFQGWHDKVAGSLMLDAAAAVSGESGSSAPDEAPVRVLSAAQPAVPTPVPTPVHPAPAQAAPTPAPPSAVAPSSAAPSRPGPIAPPDEGSLIAFVPGITADAVPSLMTSAHRPDAEPELDATVQGHAAARPAVASAASAMSAPHPAEEVEDTRISIPGHRLVFTWDDGTRVPVSRRTIFGRNPAPEDGAVVVPVRDETLSLSKTHFEAASESSGGWVLDRHSTNGMTLVREGRRIACPPGQRVPVRLGDAIEIGERIVTVGGYA